jgi:hypothetical protein
MFLTAASLPELSQPGEEPRVGQGQIGGQEERVPLCLQCLELLLTDPRAFWAGMRRGEG